MNDCDDFYAWHDTLIRWQIEEQEKQNDDNRTDDNQQ
jgi:hypothetical protein